MVPGKCLMGFIDGADQLVDIIGLQFGRVAGQVGYIELPALPAGDRVNPAGDPMIVPVYHKVYGVPALPASVVVRLSHSRSLQEGEMLSG